MSEPTFIQARSALSEHLDPELLAHSERVAEEARRIASRFGQDAEAAALAGLLHDWSRDESGERLLSAAEAGGADIDAVERSEPNLLHSLVGAMYLRERFPGLPEEVLESIAVHTGGAVGMSALAKIVFIADMTEPGRDFPGVDGIREAAEGPDLDDAFLAAYARSIQHVVETRRPLLPGTVDVWNWIVAGEAS